MKPNIKLYVKNNLVYHPTGDVVGAGFVDRIAQANGFIFAEQFVKKYMDQEIEINDELEVVQK